MSNTAPRLLTMTPISGGPGISFSVFGDPSYKPAGGGQGGWQIIDRPRLVAATQWYDRSPMSLDGKYAITSAVVNGVDGGSIESQCRTLDSWQDKVPGTNQPPTFYISGPVSGTQRVWCLYTFTYNETIRDPVAGFRTQQFLDMTLYEYNSPLQATLNNPGPAAEANFVWTSNLDGSQGYYAYTVVAGDTLQSIAANLLGNYNFWGFIAQLNNLRDPDNLFPGQVLSIPT